MQDPISKTFDHLARAKHTHAPELLVSALDIGSPRIQSAAISALFRNGNSRGTVEIVRRFREFPGEVRGVLRAQSRRIEHAVRQCLSQNDEDLQCRALELVGECESFEQISAVLPLLGTANSGLQEAAAETLTALVDRLYAYRQDASRKGDGPRDLPQLCQKIARILSERCMRSPLGPQGITLVKCLLIVGEAENISVRHVLTNAPDECRELAGHILFESTHPAVLQLICDYLSRPLSPALVLDTFGQRCDIQFITHFLRWMASHRSPTLQTNLEQVQRIAWLEPERHRIADVPADLQSGVVELIEHSGLPPEHKDELRGWIIRYGSRTGREAASSILEAMPTGAVREIVLTGLASDDAEVQSWATTQLRPRGIPNALQMLIQRLDSELGPVRATARQELSGFDFELFLKLYPRLEPQICRTAGELLLKIDPDTVAKVRREMSSPIRQRRIHAARAGAAMGLQDEIFAELVAMLQDDDMVIRRTAVEILADIDSPAMVAVLETMLDDASPRIAEIAERALQRRAGNPQQLPSPDHVETESR